MSIALMTVVWRMQVPAGRKMVLLALADAANDQGDCYPSVPTLMEKCSMSDRAVRGHLSELEAAGHITRVQRNGRSNVYQIHPRRICSPAKSSPLQNLQPTPADFAPTPAESAPYTPAESAPITVIEPLTQPSGEPPPTPASKKTSMRGAEKCADVDRRFEAFWAAWPVRKARVKALIAWRRIKPDAELTAAIIAAVERNKRSIGWQKDGGEFIPFAASWLNGRRWEDEVSEASYTEAELTVMASYNAILAAKGWPEASAEVYAQPRAVAIREFLGLSQKPGWVEAYFGWLGETLKPMEGYGFDWAIRRETFLRAREGNFAALREVA